MAQLVIHNLEDEVQHKLQHLARDHGRTVEEEVRGILREAVQEAALGADASVGLGTRISRRFAGIGLDDDIPELRGNPPEPLKFEP